MVGFKQSSLFALRVSRLFAGEQGPSSETVSLINERLSSLPSFLRTFPPSARHTVRQPPRPLLFLRLSSAHLEKESANDETG